MELLQIPVIRPLLLLIRKNSGGSISWDRWRKNGEKKNMQVNLREGFRAVRFFAGSVCRSRWLHRSQDQTIPAAKLLFGMLMECCFLRLVGKRTNTQMGSKGKMWCIEFNQHQQPFDIRKTKVTQNFWSPTCYHMLHNPTCVSKKESPNYPKFEVEIGVTSICIHGIPPFTYRESNHLFSLHWFLTLFRHLLKLLWGFLGITSLSGTIFLSDFRRAWGIHGKHQESRKKLITPWKSWHFEPKIWRFEVWKMMFLFNCSDV